MQPSRRRRFRVRRGERVLRQGGQMGQGGQGGVRGTWELNGFSICQDNFFCSLRPPTAASPSGGPSPPKAGLEGPQEGTKKWVPKTCSFIQAFQLDMRKKSEQIFHVLTCFVIWYFHMVNNATARVTATLPYQLVFFSMSFQLEHLMETKSEPCLKFLGTKFIRCDEKTWKANFPYVDFRIALTLQWKSICRYFLVFQMRIACVSFSSQEALLASTGWTWAQLHTETRNKSKNLNECHYFQKFYFDMTKKIIHTKKFQRNYLVLNYASFWETLCTVPSFKFGILKFGIVCKIHIFIFLFLAGLTAAGFLKSAPLAPTLVQHNKFVIRMLDFKNTIFDSIVAKKDDRKKV